MFILDLHFAGTDTTSNTLLTGFLYLMTYPQIQGRCDRGFESLLLASILQFLLYYQWCVCVVCWFYHQIDVSTRQIKCWERRIMQVMTTDTTCLTCRYIIRHISPPYKLCTGRASQSIVSLVLLQAVIHEVQRVANTVPLSIYHCTTTDTTLMGYVLPKVRQMRVSLQFSGDTFGHGHALLPKKKWTESKLINGLNTFSRKNIVQFVLFLVSLYYKLSGFGLLV